jgi:hypothetical protein
MKRPSKLCLTPSPSPGFEHDAVELESRRFVNCGTGGSVGGGHDSIGLVCDAGGRNGKKQEWKVVKNLKSVRGKER